MESLDVYLNGLKAGIGRRILDQEVEKMKKERGDVCRRYCKAHWRNIHPNAMPLLPMG